MPYPVILNVEFTFIKSWVFVINFLVDAVTYISPGDPEKLILGEDKTDLWTGRPMSTNILEKLLEKITTTYTETCGSIGYLLLPPLSSYHRRLLNLQDLNNL